MRRQLIQYGATLILTLCIWGHVSELFDHWDNTFKTGKDIEYSTVIVVLVAGAAIAFASVAAVVIRTLSVTIQQLSFFGSQAFAVPSRTAFISHSPPSPLRI